MEKTNILLIGAGITSSLIGFYLRNHKQIAIDLWEKEETVGGRMKTIYSEYTPVAIDVGAQYVSSPESLFRRFEDIYNSLLQNKKLVPLTCRIDNVRPSLEKVYNYTAPEGMDALVQHFNDLSKPQNIQTSYNVKKVNILPDAVAVETNTGVKQLYKAVVLTIPAPCLQELSGNFTEKIDENLCEQLKKVKYSSRFTLVVIYDQLLDVEWDATFMPDDKTFWYIVVQEKKIGINVGKSTVIFHSTKEFGAEYNQDQLDEAKELLLKKVSERFPQWRNKVDVFCYRWNCSQVLTAFQNTPGYVVLHAKPTLILAGDGFIRSNFNGCIESAKLTADALIKLL